MGQAKRRREQQQAPMALVPRVPSGPKRISADDAAYLRKVRAGLEEGARFEQEAAQHEQQAAMLRQQAIARQGAYDSVVEHLCEKYGLDKDRDNIDHATLLITRAPVLDLVPESGTVEHTTSLKPKRPPKPPAPEAEPPATTEA
jgi:hypothetical protein